MVNGSAGELPDGEPMDLHHNHQWRQRRQDPLSRPCSCSCRRCGVRRHDGPTGLLGQLVGEALRRHDARTVTPQQVGDGWLIEVGIKFTFSIALSMMGFWVYCKCAGSNLTRAQGLLLL